MSPDERLDAWRREVAASRPPLTPAQLAMLRPLWRLPQTPDATLACETRAAPEPDTDNYSWRSNSEAV